MILFIAWVAGLWWSLSLAVAALGIALGPLIVASMSGEDDADRPLLYGTVRVLCIVCSWAVMGLAFSGVCNVIVLFF